MSYVLERKAVDWQCDSDCSDWDGWQEVKTNFSKSLLTIEMKKLKQEDKESQYRVVKE